MKTLDFKFAKSETALAFIAGASSVKGVTFVGVAHSYGRICIKVMVQEEVEGYVKGVSAGALQHASFVQVYEEE
jgi:hypothetical protein